MTRGVVYFSQEVQKVVQILLRLDETLSLNFVSNIHNVMRCK